SLLPPLRPGFHPPEPNSSPGLGSHLSGVPPQARPGVKMAGATNPLCLSHFQTWLVDSANVARSTGVALEVKHFKPASTTDALHDGSLCPLLPLATPYESD